MKVMLITKLHEGYRGMTVEFNAHFHVGTLFEANTDQFEESDFLFELKTTGWSGGSIFPVYKDEACHFKIIEE